ncbi:hypothetical protein, partial [Raoultella terrigena]|uniref:hypothetical protein n=1 Tax=Raoultella terrigena TaxID=577 RepID=UPI00132FB28C
LTLSAQGGTITEMGYLEIRALPDLTPGDARAAPQDYAVFSKPVAVSEAAEVPLDPAGGGQADGIDPTSDISIGLQVVEGRGGVLLESLKDGSVRLFETLTGLEVPFNANTSGGFDTLTISPASELKPFTSYT